MLTRDQYNILENLIKIKAHNNNRKNLPIKFQTAKFNNNDVKHLQDNKYMKVTLSGEIVITDLGIKFFNGKY